MRLQRRDLKVPHPHGAILVLGVWGCLAGGHLDAVQPPTGVAASDVAFGGTETWTRRQMAEYLLVRYATRTDGPAWTLAGDLCILDAATDVVDVQAVHV